MEKIQLHTKNRFLFTRKPNRRYCTSRQLGVSCLRSCWKLLHLFFGMSTAWYSSTKMIESKEQQDFWPRKMDQVQWMPGRTSTRTGIWANLGGKWFIFVDQDNFCILRIRSSDLFDISHNRWVANICFMGFCSKCLLVNCSENKVICCSPFAFPRLLLQYCEHVDHFPVTKQFHVGGY